MQTEGILERLQDAVKNKLLGLSEFRNIPILTYKQSDLSSVMQANVKSGIGTAILLMPPIPCDVSSHVTGPVFGNISIDIKVIENTAMNMCGKSLLSLAEAVMRHLHMWNPGIADENYHLELASGSNCCRTDRQDEVNYFIIRLVMPCHLKSV